MNKSKVTINTLEDLVRSLEYPQKNLVSAVPTFCERTWNLKRRYYIDKYGQEEGVAKAQLELDEVKKQHNIQVEQRDIKYIVETTLYIVKDVMTLRNIIDNEFSGQIICYDSSGDFNFPYCTDMMDKAFEVLIKFIDKYTIDIFDGLALEKLEELHDEILRYFDISNCEKMICKIFEYKFSIGKYSK